MMPKRYRYVGPVGIRKSALASKLKGTPIRTTCELSNWFDLHRSDIESDHSLVATFTISLNEVLHLAPRRSEHVACASGGPVLSAGEITFSSTLAVTEISNQSTGFCPELESWPAVATALDAIPIDRPEDFTARVIFRLCDKCRERNIVKDDWFFCEMCGSKLPKEWNFT